MKLTKEKAEVMSFCAKNGWTMEQFAELFDEKRGVLSSEKKDLQTVDHISHTRRRSGIYRSLSAE